MAAHGRSACAGSQRKRARPFAGARTSIRESAQLLQLLCFAQEAEKVFDEVKNKLGQKKAWATTLVAREIQALMIAITHNLLLCYEQGLEDRHDVKNTAEDARRKQRSEDAERDCAKAGLPISSLVLEVRRATQRSVKFIRWLRYAIRDRFAECVAVARLRKLSAVL